MITEDVSLSHSQEGIWALEKVTPGVFNVPILATVRGEIDPEVLKAALSDVVHRHEVLRERVETRDGYPYGVVLDSRSRESFASATVQVADRDALLSFISDKARLPFDLSCEPLLDITLLRSPSRTCALFIKAHHVVFDARSMSIFARDLTELYRAHSVGQPAGLPDLPLQYPEYAHLMRERLQAGDFEHQLAYWRSALAGAPTSLNLPARTASSAWGYRGAIREHTLGSEHLTWMRSLALELNATPFMIGLVCWGLTLSCHTAQEDLLVGAPVEGRTTPETQNLIGPFVNTVALRLKPEDGKSVHTLIEETRLAVMQALENQDVPFESVIADVRPARHGRRPLIQTMFSYEDESAVGMTLPSGEEAYIEEVPTGRALFPLSAQLCKYPDKTVLRINYDADYIGPEAPDQMMYDFLNILARVSDDPACRIGDIRAVIGGSPYSRARTSAEARAVDVDPRALDALHQIVEHRTRTSPQAAAAYDGKTTVTFGQLDVSANQLARLLLERGVVFGDRVAVALPRGVDWLAAVLAAMKVGGAYVPVDPDWPVSRASAIIRDSVSKVVVTSSSAARTFESMCEVISFDAPTTSVSAERSIVAPLRAPSRGDLAAVLYTSGSTGRPKGVMITHHNLLEFCRAAVSTFNLTERDRFLQLAPLSFDVQFEEIFPVWLAGGSVIVDGTALGHTTPTELMRKVEDHGATILELPTIYWQQLTSALEDELITVPRSLHCILVGGERVRTSDFRRWRSTGLQLVNVYGLTECAVTSSCHRGWGVAGIDEVPIGRAMAHAELRVVTDGFDGVESGAGSGEIVIGGPGVALGYLGDPALTAERFVPDPFSGRPGARLYRTGDQAYVLPDGEIVFIGRYDDQLKVSGVRVEPAEVEAALEEDETVRQSVVVGHEAGGRTRLVAYVIASDGFDEARLRESLARRLPSAMVPNRIIQIARFPMTQHGKIARAMLASRPFPKGPLPSAAGPVFSGDVERRIASIWREILDLPAIGPDDNFFAVGGTSISAVAVSTRIQQAFGLDFPLSRLLGEKATVRLLAAAVSDYTGTRTRGAQARLEVDGGGDG